MSRKFQLSNNWYGDDCNKIFNKKQITINDGLTILVGCNGAGKTTLLSQIKNALESKEIPVLLHSNMINGERELRSKAVFFEKYDVVARTLMSSEGENIVCVMEEVAKNMGKIARENPNSKELWFLFDAIDSGLSIDNIVEIKEVLIPTVIEIEKGKDIYFVISSNSYEFARNTNCFDVMNGNYITFKDYEEYRNFILKTRDEKNERCETVR